MTPAEFERVLSRAASILTENLRSSSLYNAPDAFEQHALDMLRVAARDTGFEANPTYHPRAFPDIKVNGFGVEVKFTQNDTWNAVGNSIFEGMRDSDVSDVYVLYGKAGGTPEVRWDRYGDCVTHVRVSNSPRFVISMDRGEAQSLFTNISVSYEEFAALSDDEKMRHVRDYSRENLQPGERLWWLEESHTLPVNVRLYANLPQDEKRVLRAEAALLCPKVCAGPRVRGKYDDAAMYLLTHHGVLCTQVRDLFSAGSVALRQDAARGGNYTQRALEDIQDLMRAAAERLDDALFVEYWGASCPPHRRIDEWLVRADKWAGDHWTPSDHLFQD